MSNVTPTRCEPTLIENPIPKRLVTKRELIEFLHVSERSYYRLLKEGIPRVVVLGERRFNLAEVLAFLRSRGE